MLPSLRKVWHHEPTAGARENLGASADLSISLLTMSSSSPATPWSVSNGSHVLQRRTGSQSAFQDATGHLKGQMTSMPCGTLWRRVPLRWTISTARASLECGVSQTRPVEKHAC